MREGYASIAPARGARVHGALWRVAARDLAALNAYENVGAGLYRRRVVTVRAGGRRWRALAYVGRNRGPGRPRPGYLDGIVIAAAREWMLPRRYIAALARSCPTRWRAPLEAEPGSIA